MWPETIPLREQVTRTLDDVRETLERRRELLHRAGVGRVFGERHELAPDGLDRRKRRVMNR